MGVQLPLGAAHKGQDRLVVPLAGQLRDGPQAVAQVMALYPGGLLGCGRDLDTAFQRGQTSRGQALYCASVSR